MPALRASTVLMRAELTTRNPYTFFISLSFLLNSTRLLRPESAVASTGIEQCEVSGRDRQDLAPNSVLLAPLDAGGESQHGAEEGRTDHEGLVHLLHSFSFR